MSDDKPTIDVQEGGPLLVKGLQKLTDSRDLPIKTVNKVIVLCRCGASQNKPFCDGSHTGTGFTGAKERQETSSARQYEGQELTIVDDAGVCCHAGSCVDGAPEAFFKWEGEQRVSVPDGCERDKIIAAIRACPSGALAYKLDGKIHDEFFNAPEIFVAEDGPLHVRGGIETAGETPPTTDHYTLCRCGASKNKPYCDGAHKDAGFKG